jgi:hypothetical protein
MSNENIEFKNLDPHHNRDVGKGRGRTLILIPVKVSGDLAGPDVAFLAPSAEGSRTLELMKNTYRCTNQNALCATTSLRVLNNLS